MRTLPILMLSICFVSLTGCPRDPEGASEDALDDLSEAVREIETLQAENRSLRREVRALRRASNDLQEDLEKQTAAAEKASGRIATLEKQARALEQALAMASRASGSRPEPASPPAPSEIASLFLEAIRSRDREAIDALVDWEGLLAAALLESAPTPQEGRTAIARFRDLSDADRQDRVEAARKEFLDSVLSGDASYVLPGRGARGPGFIRYRIPKEDATGFWTVLLQRGSEGDWKVVGLVWESRPEEEPGGDGEGQGEEGR